MHVRDRMPSPAVARLELDGATALPLGGVQVAALLEAERMHAQQRVEARLRPSLGGVRKTSALATPTTCLTVPRVGVTITEVSKKSLV